MHLSHNCQSIILFPVIYLAETEPSIMLDVLINQSSDRFRRGGIIRFSNRVDKPLKSFLKSVSWRIIGTLDTMIISYFITGRVSLAVSIGGIEVFTKTILYYFHERLWARIHRIKLNILKNKEA
jgi:uncharacterized membrane protein